MTWLGVRGALRPDPAGDADDGAARAERLLDRLADGGPDALLLELLEVLAASGKTAAPDARLRAFCWRIQDALQMQTAGSEPAVGAEQCITEEGNADEILHPPTAN